MCNLIEKCKKKYSEDEMQKISRAIEFATEKHDGQVRESGDLYITHPLAVAEILLDIGMDANCLTAAVLHDVVEDCGVTVDEITEMFGHEVAVMVDGVTKLSTTAGQFTNTKEERQAESIRKMFLAIAQDVRVVIIKLADRLHNMRTIDCCSPEKQLRVARDTINIYAPLAHRFGVGAIKCELEDLALKYIDPEEYEKLKTMIEPRQMERMALLNSAMDRIRETLAKNGIEAKVNGRPKHLYSIYRKMIKQNIEFDEIYDLTALRVIVSTVADCYAALGIVHTMWRPVPGRFKDYISAPKPNMYQSIHTTLFSENGLPFEVQIRTVEMHRAAEYGVAAHWMYKEGKTEQSPLDERLAWFRRALEYQDFSSNAQEFVNDIKFDFFSEYVFVVTPRGKIIDLPVGSTPLDFAYRIHTDIGHKALRAKVNGSLVRFDYELKTNDIVEIITGPVENPNMDWLKIVKTQQAKAKIKQWFKRAQRDDDIDDGRELLIDALKKQNMSLSDFTEEDIDNLLKRLSLLKMEDVYAAIGRGQIAVTSVINKLNERQRLIDEEAALHDRIAEQLEESENKPLPGSAGKGVLVKGFPTMAVHFANCCNPLPGDDIFGYVTRGRGVSVHRTGCANAKTLLADKERILEVEWQSGQNNSYIVYITIVATERKGLLADVSRSLLGMNIDIKYINADTDSDNKYAYVKLAFEIEDTYRLKAIMASLRDIGSVIDVYRVNG